jgi:hypothetical protein
VSPGGDRAAAGGVRPRWELADVFRQHGAAYRAGRRLPASQLAVMRAVEACRTARLGGHLERCDSCGHERPAYNSCRNRHCPKCQSLAKARWLAARRRELLPAGYFHVVFTLPHRLNRLVPRNKREVYELLFAAASGTLLEFGESRLGGRLGFTALLHTWDQKLRRHLHLHCVVAGGALSSDGSRWRHARRKYLFPVRALSKVFRGKFMEGLRAALADGRLRFADGAAAFQSLVDGLYRTPWVVYAKPPFGGPEKALDYLGRYTHRVAISNHRILDVSDGQVTFAYRDRAAGDVPRTMRLTAGEFIRRFLLHVLPKSFMRIRHYGFLAGPSKGRDLARCRELLGLEAAAPEPAARSAVELLRELTGVDVTVCPRCRKGRMRPAGELPRMTEPEPPVQDSS